MKLSLNELVARWRLTTVYYRGVGAYDAAKATRECADELESALAASVAEQTQNDPEFRAKYEAGCAQIAAGLGARSQIAATSTYECGYGCGTVIPKGAASGTLTDEQIHAYADESAHGDIYQRDGFIDGARWARSQITEAKPCDGCGHKAHGLNCTQCGCCYPLVANNQ